MQDAGVPPGVVNIVPSTRASTVVGAMLNDPRVRKLSFTGSTAVGRLLLASAASSVISCSMELGGNAPFIVLDDADVDAAVEGAMIAKLRNGGEACTAANRFYVHRSLIDEFGQKLADRMAALTLGPGTDEATDIGPLVNAAAREKVIALVDDAIDRGAEVLVGGHVPDGTGWFYPPTVLTGVAPSSTILANEIFGPVAPVVGFDSDDEVIALANDSEYGLVSYLYAGDIGRGLRVAEQLESGMVGLNRGVVSDPAAPFGGVKQSGLGREGGHDGILEYLETQYVACSW
jgi:succinate-semialdehyde dehydrogenase/glutarate-semialdehyde dehydrogenase